MFWGCDSIDQTCFCSTSQWFSNRTRSGESGDQGKHFKVNVLFLKLFLYRFSFVAGSTTPSEKPKAIQFQKRVTDLQLWSPYMLVFTADCMYKSNIHKYDRSQGFALKHSPKHDTDSDILPFFPPEWILIACAPLISNSHPATHAGHTWM